MWLRVLRSRKVAIYSDRDDDDDIIIGGGGGVCVGLSWYYVGSYPRAKYWWKIKVVKKNEDVVRY